MCVLANFPIICVKKNTYGVIWCRKLAINIDMVGVSAFNVEGGRDLFDVQIIKWSENVGGLKV